MTWIVHRRMLAFVAIFAASIVVIMAMQDQPADATLVRSATSANAALLTPTPSITPTVTPTPLAGGDAPEVVCFPGVGADALTGIVGEPLTIDVTFDCVCDPEPDFETEYDCEFIVIEIVDVISGGLLEEAVTPIGPPAPDQISLQAIQTGQTDLVVVAYGDLTSPIGSNGVVNVTVDRSITVPLTVLDVPPTITPTPTPPLAASEAAIAGQITTLSGGEPIFGAEVCASRTFPAFERCAFSTFTGEYTIRDLLPGNYAITAIDPGQRFLQNCWGSLPCEQPQLLGVGSAERATGVDIALDPLFSQSFPTPTPTATTMPEPFGSVSGTVLADNRPLGNTEVCIFSALISNGFCDRTDDTGFYQFRGLATANYTVRVSFVVGTDPVYELVEYCYRSAPLCVDAIPVGVVSPMGRDGIDFDLYSSDFDAATIFYSPTPLPGEGPFGNPPTPTPTPSPTATSLPHPHPTITPTPQLTPVPIGQLPMFLENPSDLVAFVGTARADPFLLPEETDRFTLYELIGNEEWQRISRVNFDEDNMNETLTQLIGADGSSRDVILSVEMTPDQWTVVRTWRVDFAPDQLMISPGNDNCAFIGESDNGNVDLIVGDAGSRPIGAWIWQDNSYVPFDVNNISCS